MTKGWLGGLRKTGGGGEVREKGKGKNREKVVGNIEKRVKGKNREKVVGNIEKGWVGRKGGCMGGENK